MIKKTAPHVYTYLLALWTVIVLTYITKFQLRLFHHALYVRQSRLNVDWVVNNSLIFKLTASVLFCVLGIGCYFIYLLAVEQNIFLHLTRLCFISSGMISCLWEINTMFVITRNERLLWIKSGDFFFFLFIIQALSILLIQFMQSYLFFIRLSFFCTVPFTCAVLLLTPTNAALMLKVYFFFFFSFSLFLSIRAVYIESIKRALLNIFFLLYLNFIAYQFLKVRMSPGLIQQNHYMQAILPILLFYVLLSFFYGFREYQNRIFYSKTLKLKIREADRFKRESIENIRKFTQAPLNTINGLNEILSEDKKSPLTPYQNEVLGKMKLSIYKLNTIMDNLHTYNLLQGNAASFEMMKVSFYTILESAIDSLICDDVLSSKSLINCTGKENEDYIYGDPLYLMKINYSFLLTLLDLQHDGKIEIATEKRDSNLFIKMISPIDEGSYKKAKRTHTLLNQKLQSLNILSTREEELSTVVARNLLSLQNGELHTKISSDNFFILTYSIPVWNEKADDEYAASMDIQENKTGISQKNKVILISTLPEQIEMVKTYLEFTDYHLIVFNTVEDIVKYMERTRHITAILIGTTFLKMTSQQICDNIRKNYSMGQMPIILIRREIFVRPTHTFLSEINDIIVEPFSRKELLWKLDCASYLKKSVSMALKSRIDFLQSQMDPHFIFNAINTIMPLCIEAPEKAYNLLGSFSNYLRGSLFAGELQKSVSIYKELELVQAYLEIEAARFHDMIAYTLNVNCNSAPRILPLMIEPIVENCVKHGRRNTEKLTIQVDVIQDDEWIYIQVQDDGIGISHNRILQIQEMDTQNSIGLANLMKRLKLYYRETLNISSKAGEGTLISYKIPSHSIEFD